MRNLKYRVWDKIDKRLIVHEQEFIPLKVTNIGVFRLDAEIKENRWELVDNNRFKIMQYSEQNDINGNEIYEEDIVNQKSVLIGSPDIDFTGTIKFYDGSWWIEGKKEIVLLFNESCENTIIGNSFEGLRR